MISNKQKPVLTGTT